MRQLEAVRRQLPRVLEMRAAAQVLPIAVPIHPQVLAFGNAGDQLDLERLVLVLIELDRIGAGPDLGPHRLTRVDDLLHARFNRAKVFGRERFRPVKVVKPAIVAHRADGDLDVLPQLLHCAGHDMRQIMPDQLQRRAVILHRVDGDAGVGMDRPLQVPVLAVQLRRNRGLAERGRDGRGHFASRHASSVVALVAVGKCQGNLAHESSPRRFGVYETPGCGLCAAGFDLGWLGCQGSGGGRKGPWVARAKGCEIR